MEPLDLTRIHPILGIDPATGIKESEPHRPDGQPIAGKAANRHADEIVIDQSRFEFAGRQSVNDKVNKVARTIRIVDQTMTQIEENLQQMKKQLIEFRKLYPPFPPGSKERAEMLQHFNLLKKQIDALTFPAESPEASQIMADPELNPAAGDWHVSINDHHERLHIKHQPVHTGAAGLDILELPSFAGDAEIDAMIEKLDQAQQTLTRRRSGLEIDVRQQIV